MNKMMNLKNFQKLTLLANVALLVAGCALIRSAKIPNDSAIIAIMVLILGLYLSPLLLGVDSRLSPWKVNVFVALLLLIVVILLKDLYDDMNSDHAKFHKVMISAFATSSLLALLTTYEHFRR